MNEMSDSREVYDSRPSKIVPVFIYVCLSFLLIALTWMFFGRIDIVVNSSGMIRPNDSVSTISNVYGGILKEVVVEDGQVVTEGQTLYVIELSELLANQTYYQDQITYYEHQLRQLQTYLKSVQDQVSYFRDSKEDLEYVTKFKSYQIQLDSLQAQYDLNHKDITYQIEYFSAQIEYYKNQINEGELLLRSIQQEKNLCSKDGKVSFYHQYELYQIDYASLKKQYEEAATDIKLSTTKESLNNSYEYYTNMKTGLVTLINSVELEKDKFDQDNNYHMQFDAYLDKRKELWQAYQSALDTYEVNSELKGLAVTDWETEESRLACEKAKKNYESYKSSTLLELKEQLKEVDQKLQEVKLSKDNTLSQEDLLADNSKTKQAALEQFKLKYEIDLKSNLKSLNETLTALEDKLSTAKRSQEAIIVYEKQGQPDQYAAVLKYQNDEINTTIQTINAYNAKKGELETSLESVNQNIDSCNVKAPCSGIINLSLDLVEGDYLAAGSEVLTILPTGDSKYKVLIYISNSEIGKITNGMQVKLNIQAYPNSDYGYFYGTITKVSNDIKVDSQSGMGYYLAEAKLDANGFYDKDGTKLTIKAGMNCEAKTITGDKSIMTFVLDKLKLLVTD